MVVATGWLNAPRQYNGDVLCRSIHTPATAPCSIERISRRTHRGCRPRRESIENSLSTKCWRNQHSVVYVTSSRFFLHSSVTLSRGNRQTWPCRHLFACDIHPVSLSFFLSIFLSVSLHVFLLPADWPFCFCPFHVFSCPITFTSASWSHDIGDMPGVYLRFFVPSCLVEVSQG